MASTLRTASIQYLLITDVLPGDVIKADKPFKTSPFRYIFLLLLVLGKDIIHMPRGAKSTRPQIKVTAAFTAIKELCF